jgi:hypothetical protein
VPVSSAREYLWKKKATWTRWTAWTLGLGASMGGALLWACSSSSSQANVLGGTFPEDSSIGVVSEASVHDAGKAGEAGDAGGGHDAAAEAEAAAPVCPLVDAGCVTAASCGAQVNVVEVPQAPPTATGGTVVAGTYVMTDYSIFTGSGGATGMPGPWYIETQYLTLVGDAGADTDDASSDGGAGEGPQTFQLVRVITESDGGAATTLTGSVTFSSPAQATFTFDCPSTEGTEFDEYSTTATTLQIFVNAPIVGVNGPGVLTFTKQ